MAMDNLMNWDDEPDIEEIERRRREALSRHDSKGYRLNCDLLGIPRENVEDQVLYDQGSYGASYTGTPVVNEKLKLNWETDFGKFLKGILATSFPYTNIRIDYSWVQDSERDGGVNILATYSYRGKNIVVQVAHYDKRSEADQDDPDDICFNYARPYLPDDFVRANRVISFGKSSLEKKLKEN